MSKWLENGHHLRILSDGPQEGLTVCDRCKGGESDLDTPCIERMEKRVAELQAWKQSALQLETEWDEQAIAKMLGAKPGESCRKVIKKRVPEILGELDMANDALHEARLALGSHDKPFICDAIRSLLEKLEAANQDAERLAVCLQAIEGDCDIGSLARRALAMHETRTN